MRLDRFLHEAGHGTRREIFRMLRIGRVAIAGAVERDGSRHVKEGEEVRVDGAVVALRGLRVVAFHKPRGLVTAARDHRLPTIYSALPFGPEKLLPVGRLDRETEGLLLLTDDGSLHHRLTDPKRHVEKEYLAWLDEPLDASALERLRSPLDIGKGDTARAARSATLEDPRRLRLVIDEGKYHQVRRMVAALGSHVVRLVRTRIGALPLDPLPLGAHRELTDDEHAALRIAVGLPITAEDAT